MSVSAEQRDKLFTLLRQGHDLEAAAATAGLELEVVQGDAELLAACSNAYRVGTAKLRTKLLEAALSDGNAHILERAIAARESAGRELFRAQAEERADGDFDLTKLTDAELEIVEAALSGDFGRLNQLITQRANCHIDAMRADLMREAEAAAARSRPIAQIIPPPKPRPRDPEPPLERLEVLDQGTPLRPDRAPVVIEERAPSRPARPRVLRDSSSPWHDGSSDYQHAFFNSSG